MEPAPRTRGEGADARLLTATGWAVGLLCTVLVIGTPNLVFGYHNPELHLILDTADACVALLLAYLLLGRFRRRRRLQDLFLVEALALLAAAGLGLSLLMELVATPDQSYDAWLPLALRATGAVLVAAAALAGARAAGKRTTAWGVAAPLLLIATTAALLTAYRGSLPVAASASPPAPAAGVVITGHPLLLVVQSVAAACFLLASLCFTLQARRSRDEVLRWLGPACALGGFARINYVLFPSLYSDWLYTGDLLRTGCYLCLLVGTAREIGRYWSAHAQVAVVEDRRRLARELHDGLVQELNLIKSEVRAGAVGGRSVLEACDRALDEARSAVDALGRDSAEPLGYALHRAARDVAERYGGQVVVELDDTVEAEQHQRHDLGRIVREAVGNALRHGGASCVRIVLERADGRRRLVVHDDGRGFDAPTASRGTGFGLTSMRERATGLPGSFDLRSGPEEGTTVEVTW